MNDYSGLNTDELIQRIKQDELSEAELITPVDYAKIRPITSQLVYYAIRSKKLELNACPCCGRKCINKAEADAYYQSVRGEVAWPYSLRKDSNET